MVAWTGSRIQALSLHRQIGSDGWLPTRGLLSRENYPFFVAYAWALQKCFLTIGEQYNDALAQAEEEGWALPNSEDSHRSALTALLSGHDAEEATSGVKEVHLPWKYLPGFWPVLWLAVVFILHLLMVLLQHWSVAFRCLVRFRPVRDDPTQATHAMARPKPHCGNGKTLLVPVETSPLGPAFEFHRRKYVYDQRSQAFVKIRCRVDRPLSFYRRWRGLPTEAAVESARLMYGTNRFEMEMPKFLDLYKAQLLSPFTIFQLFSTALWLLDSYWQYFLFTLFMIASFEATVVMQRLKNLQTLKGMGNDVVNLKVFRAGRWQSSTTEELLPGDLFSLRRSKKHDTVPCDCMLVHGSAVLNEATLTGESVPQMKEGVLASKDGGDEIFMMKEGHHKVFTLFGGTKLLTCNSQGQEAVDAGGDSDEGSEEEEDDMEETEDQEGRAEEKESEDEDEDESSVDVGDESWKETPDGGCLCYVLRTGFSSSQGKLVRMIEGSTETVRTDTRDTVLLLLLLLVFAVSASTYVLIEGMKDSAKRSKYQLLLHCILIVTSVIPPELPMQMALAVNSSLMALMKMQIFCTEPYRVPMAGKVDVCLFDKTGTLTTDELVAVGVEAPAPSRGEGSGGRERGGDRNLLMDTLVPMREAPAAATLVLAGCQSLVLMEGSEAGDPVEAAAMKAIKWEIVPGASNTCRPKGTPAKPATKAGRTAAGKVTVAAPAVASTPGEAVRVDGCSVPALDIKTRHHFSSKLQRMSTVARTQGNGSWWVLVKGSPEAIGARLGDGERPKDYDERAARLAKGGMRVLALAYKRPRSDEEGLECEESRAVAEQDLRFAGFVAFSCRVRKDTRSVVLQLREGAHSVAMVTGDAILTALHVANEVGITLRNASKDAQPLPILTLEALGSSEGGGLVWKSYDTGLVEGPFRPEHIYMLSLTHSLAVTGKVLVAALEEFPSFSKSLQYLKVFARMTPDEKETLVLALKDSGRTCMMCGDGANDVGALKQAQVGVALLGGFGDINVDRSSKDGGDTSAGSGTPGSTALAIPQGELMKLRVPELKKKLAEAGVDLAKYPGAVEKTDLVKLYMRAVQRKPAAAVTGGDPSAKDLSKMAPAEKKKEIARRRAEAQKEKVEQYQRRVAELTAAGESWATVKAIKEIYAQDAAKAKAMAAERKKNGSIEMSAAKMAAMMDEAGGGGPGGDVPMVKIGDASVAAPFTSKLPSIKGTVDIIRQGRCTLITSIQMNLILALNCLISAYSLSVLYLDGVKYGDRQMTALGMLMSVSFITISRAKPLSKLSPVRPITSIFHPALFLSILGQFSLHMGCMVYAVARSKEHLEEGYEPDLDGEFKPNMINSVVFLVGAVQQVSVFVVNLKGRPFMGGLSENRPLLYSLAATFALTFMSASETIPRLNKWLQLEPFPDDNFRNAIMLVLVLDIVAAFLWDRLMLLVFAPRILWASVEGTTWKDVTNALKVVAICYVVIYFLATAEDPEEFERLLAEEAEAAKEEVVMEANDAAAGST
ncbi:unnamed protein product [Ectocarpus sp. CCAP 1310/34]|nr:unnamed protein product [Ectocarpus sp. CCAP 1310/34]